MRWLNLRGWVFGLPLLVIVMAGSVDTVTEYALDALSGGTQP